MIKAVPKIRDALDALEHLESNWLRDEAKHYTETYLYHDDEDDDDTDEREADDIPTDELQPHNYTDLRVLRDFLQNLKEKEDTESIEEDHSCEYCEWEDGADEDNLYVHPFGCVKLCNDCGKGQCVGTCEHTECLICCEIV